MNYYMNTIVNMTFEEAIDKVTEELKTEGFGVLTEIDVKNTLRNKLDVDFRPYKILGACNPPFAYKALSVEKRVGLLLPCNVVVQKFDDNTIEVSTIDPVAAMGTIDNDTLKELAGDLRTKLSRVLAALV